VGELVTSLNTTLSISMPTLTEATPTRVPEDALPAYEQTVEPMTYFMVHAFCLAASLFILWQLFQSPMELKSLISSVVMWCLLGFCSYRSILGIRYGNVLRVYRGYLELSALGPTRVLTAGEIIGFIDAHSHNYFRRRVFLQLRSGETIRLPRVEDPITLCRSLMEELGVRPQAA
jgi:hypothetical protein